MALVLAWLLSSLSMKLRVKLGMAIVLAWLLSWLGSPLHLAMGMARCCSLGLALLIQHLIVHFMYHKCTLHVHLTYKLFVHVMYIKCTCYSQLCVAIRAFSRANVAIVLARLLFWLVCCFRLA